MDVGEILPELLHHIANLFKILLIEGRLVNLGLVWMLEGPELGERNGCLESWIWTSVSVSSAFDWGLSCCSACLTIPDLSPVPFHLANLSVHQDVILCPPRDFEVFALILEFVKELSPDLLPLVFFQIFVVNDDVDP